MFTAEYILSDHKLSSFLSELMNSWVVNLQWPQNKRTAAKNSNIYEHLLYLAHCVWNLLPLPVCMSWVYL